MLVELTPEEREALLTLVEREIADLGPEIRHTDTRSYRDDLKTQKRKMVELRAHLQAATVS
jgi:hypothetical protein